MTNMICRLCLNDAKLINIFDVRLTNSEQLRKCILLATGVEISHDDMVSKYICQYCSDIAIFLYKYRKKALANDKALKEYANQKLSESRSQTKDIMKFNNHIIELLEAEEQKDRPPEQINNPVIKTLQKVNSLVTKPPEIRIRPPSSTGLAVHPTIIQLIKSHPKLKIPNDLLKCNIQPNLILNKSEIDDWEQQVCKQEKEIIKKEISDMERFKLMCPGISIMKIIEPAENKPNQLVKIVEKPKVAETKTIENKLAENKIICTVIRSEPTEALNNNVLKKRKASSASPSDMSKKKKIKEQDVATPEVKERSTRKRNPPKRLSTPIDEQVPKLKIVLRKPSSENSTPTPELQTQPAKKPSLEESTRKPVYHGRAWISPLITQDNNSESEKEITQSQESDAQEISPVKLHRNNLFASDTEHSDNESIGAHDVMSTDDLLDTVEEEAVIHCVTCNKMFTTHHQLKCHQRVHKVCSICKVIFRSGDALRYHQKDICFKTVIANPPNLQLTKVDEIPEILKLYPSAFDLKQGDVTENDVTASTSETASNAEEILCISDDDDDDDVVIVDSSNTDANDPITNSNDSITNSNEYQYIRSVFKKYRDVKLPFTKQKSTETKPKIFVKYNQKNQIVLENMYPELKSYRVPVELVAKPTSFAYIAFSKKPQEPRDIYCWATEPVVKLNDKKHLLSILLNPSPSRSKYQHILPKTAHPQYKKTEVSQTHNTIHNLKSLPTQTTSTFAMAKTTPNPMPPPFILNKNASQALQQPIPSSSTATMTISTNETVIEVPPIDTITIDDAPKVAEVPVMTVPIMTVPTTTVPIMTVPVTTVPIMTVPVTTVPVTTLPITTVPITPVPDTIIPVTTVPVMTAPPKENSFCLRVKTPWELNTL